MTQEDDDDTNYILCHTGLSRLRLQHVSDDQLPIQCVVIHEDDPNLDDHIDRLVTLTTNGKIQPTAVVIAVPSGQAASSPVADGGTGSGSEDETLTFDSKMDKLRSNVVSPVPDDGGGRGFTRP